MRPLKDQRHLNLALFILKSNKKTAQEMDDKEREVDVTSLDNIIRSLVESLNYFPVSAIPQNSQQQQQQQKKG